MGEKEGRPQTALLQWGICSSVHIPVEPCAMPMQTCQPRFRWYLMKDRACGGGGRGKGGAGTNRRGRKILRLWSSLLVCIIGQCWYTPRVRGEPARQGGAGIGRLRHAGAVSGRRGKGAHGGVLSRRLLGPKAHLVHFFFRLVVYFTPSYVFSIFAKESLVPVWFFPVASWSKCAVSVSSLVPSRPFVFVSYFGTKTYRNSSYTFESPRDSKTTILRAKHSKSATLTLADRRAESCIAVGISWLFQSLPLPSCPLVPSRPIAAFTFGPRSPLRTSSLCKSLQRPLQLAGIAP